MIIRSQQKGETLWQRFLRWARPVSPRQCPGLVSAKTMQYELARETSRSNRRTSNQEFALVILRFLDPDAQNHLNDLVPSIANRLRISDTIGWFEDQVAVLLPETDREGAMLVANDLAKIGLAHAMRFDTEVRVYPWDDELVHAVDEQKADSHNTGDKVVDELSAHAKIAFQPMIATPWWKRMVDMVGASAGLICLWPVFAAAAIAIKLEGPGPVFFKQKREGKDGKCFDIWKFRTMYRDADDQKEDLRHISEQEGPAFKLTDDPRVTGVGRYLRKSCIDELPQLINVLRGEMSLVGPRPLPVNESLACKSWQRHRLRALPGLTCNWQIEGNRETRFNNWMRMDLQYLRRRSFFYDLKLILKTAVLAVMHRGSV